MLAQTTQVVIKIDISCLLNCRRPSPSHPLLALYFKISLPMLAGICFLSFRLSFHKLWCGSKTKTHSFVLLFFQTNSDTRKWVRCGSVFLHIFTTFSCFFWQKSFYLQVYPSPQIGICQTQVYFSLGWKITVLF